MSTILLTDTGRANFSALFAGSGAAFAYVGWGSGTTTPTRTDTALGTEIAPRAGATVTATTTSIANDTLLITATLTAIASITVAEAGVFTTSTAGVLGVHAGFTPRALQVGDAIAFSFHCQFS
jgi:carbohydrate-binding DOMON domain-containing protein